MRSRSLAQAIRCARRCRWLVALTVAACASVPTDTYKLYPGPERPEEELAFLAPEAFSVVWVDRALVASTDWAAVALLPGPHEIDLWYRQAGVRLACASFAVELMPGHRYRLVIERNIARGMKDEVGCSDDTVGGLCLVSNPTVWVDGRQISDSTNAEQEK